MFIFIVYMFRANMCPSSGELIVLMWHLLYVTLCRWPSGMHTRRSSTQRHIPGVTFMQLILLMMRT